MFDIFKNYPYLYPLFGGIAHGKFLDWWIHRYYGAFYQVAKIYYPENPRTPSQQGQRTLFYDAIQNWWAFDQATKNYYNELIRPEHMSGINRYFKLYFNANYPMIIYWEQQHQSATQPLSIPEYMAEPYFSGVQRIRSLSSYPVSPPYGALIYRSDLKKFFRFQQDTGWAGFDAAGGQAFPIGSVFISVVSTDPATLLGYGTWSAIAAGRVLVGLDAGDADFNTAEKTGGAKTSTPNAHSGATVADHAAKNTDAADTGATAEGSTASTLTLKAHFHNISAYVHTVGQAIAHAAMSIVQPYFVVYIWKRTA
ncbi:MAG: hypothetical protein NTV06_06450 [candidate division Zixibacteria bacterium]|nr:hypothetical protein [candidate division Zixibacteria bacterium]